MSKSVNKALTSSPYPERRRQSNIQGSAWTKPKAAKQRPSEICFCEVCTIMSLTAKYLLVHNGVRHRNVSLITIAHTYTPGTSLFTKQRRSADYLLLHRYPAGRDVITTVGKQCAAAPPHATAFERFNDKITRQLHLTLHRSEDERHQPEIQMRYVYGHKFLHIYRHGLLYR